MPIIHLHRITIISVLVLVWGAGCSNSPDASCVPHHESRCVGTDLYWYDSCGEQETLKADCSYDEQAPCLTDWTCAEGQCTHSVRPDGTTCSDDDWCTVGDHCQQGECVGEVSASGPQIIGRLNFFGSSMYARAATFGSDSMLVSDAFPLRLSKVDVDSEHRLQLDVQTDFEQYSRSSRIHALGATRLVTLTADAQNGPAELTASVFSLGDSGFDQEGQITLGGSISVWTGNWDCAPTAVFQDAFYVCDGDQVRVFDTVGLTEVEALTLPGSCRDFAIDEARARLFVGMVSDQGLIAYDLTNPLAPTEAQHVMAGTWVWNLATDGTVLLVQEHITAEQIHILDPDSLTSLGTIDGLYTYDLRAVEQGFVILRWLFNSDEIELWDISQPADPLMLGKESRSERILPNSNDCRMIDAGDNLVFLGGTMGLEIREIDLNAPQILQHRTGPRHGRLAALTVADDTAQVVNINGSWKVDLGDRQLPTSVAGGTWQQNADLLSPAADSLKNSSFARTLHTDPGRSLRWLEISNPDIPVALGTVVFPDARCRVVAATADYFVALAIDSGSDNPASLEIYFWQQQTPGDLSPLVPATEIPLPTTNAVCGEFNALSFAQDRLALAIARREELAGNILEQSDLLIMNLEEPTEAWIQWTEHHDRAVTDMKLFQDRFVVLEINPNNNGALLRVFDLLTGPTDLGALDLDTPFYKISQEILYVDKSIALIADIWSPPFKLSWIDLTTEPPSIRGKATVSEAIRSLRISGEDLIFTTDSSLQVMHPPCPVPQ